MYDKIKCYFTKIKQYLTLENLSEKDNTRKMCKCYSLNIARSGGMFLTL